MKRKITQFFLSFFLLSTLVCGGGVLAQTEVPDFPDTGDSLADPNSIDFSDDIFFDSFSNDVDSNELTTEETDITTTTTEVVLDTEETTPTTTSEVISTTTAVIVDVETGPFTDWMIVILIGSVFMGLIFFDLVIKSYILR